MKDQEQNESGRFEPEAFDGSFLLTTGEVITGGYFVEEAQGRFLFMDTGRLQKGGLFERTGNTTFRSVVPHGTVEIEFGPGAGGSVGSMTWREQDSEPIRGERVFPHRERDIQFTSGDGTVLHGRLLLPQCGGPHPVVVSVHGSGPVDRYGGPYHTFFLKHGLAVLAYDKRGYTTDRQVWKEPDLAVLSADAAAAVRFAAAQDDLDAGRVGLVGSSQAGWVVPRAAVEAPQTAFIILRAGAVVSELETVLHEIRQDLRREGVEGLDLDYAVDLRREIYTLAVRGESISAADDIAAPYLGQSWYRVAFGEGSVSRLWSDQRWGWMQRNLAVAATPHLEQYCGPVLWFLAEHDENVPLVPTRAALERALLASPGSDHEVVVLKGALHSFLIPSPGGPPRFSPGFFDRMGSWIEEHGFSDPACWD